MPTSEICDSVWVNCSRLIDSSLTTSCSSGVRWSSPSSLA